MWHNNKTVIATFAHHTSQWAWAEIEGIGFKRIKDGAADGVTNLFALFNAACTNGRKVNVFVDASDLIATAYLL